MAARGTAGRRSNLQIVVVTGVTVRARRNLSGRRELMQVLQRKAGGIVAPGGSPAGGGVATGALRRRESGGNVIRDRAPHIGCAVVLVLVAAVAIGVRRGERVVVIDMAGCARSGRMNTSERPSGAGVVKRRGVPGNRVVAR